MQRPGAMRALTDLEVQVASNEVRDSLTYSYNSEQDCCPFFNVTSTGSGLWR